MGLAYAPFELDPEIRPPSYVDPIKLKIQDLKVPEQDATECNYLVMFFVIGIFALALSDTLKSSQ